MKGVGLIHAAGALPRLTVISVIDILVVAFVIYEFLALIKGTRAALILVGVTVIALSVYFLRLEGLVTLTWVVNRVRPYALIALVVVFAPEIREALARLGRRLTMTRASGSESEIGLRTYVESGVALEARLSYDLLATIFRPSAPLHDGAVIVHGDRVAAAACFLPLSMNPVLSTQLGTRHRAGIGITEETDAIAVIVSEETGSISLAVAGSIERDLTVDQLRERMGQLLRRYVPPTVLPTPMTNGGGILDETEEEMPVRGSEQHSKPGRRDCSSTSSSACRPASTSPPANVPRPAREPRC